MIILLDIDGVLVTTPSWKPAELLADGFLKFNEKAASNLARIIAETNASVVLTTTHRISYPVEKWKELLQTRGINPASISKINEVTALCDMADRAIEIQEWVNKQVSGERFVIVDDDLSINGLPPSIKEKCVLTSPMIGLDEAAATKALDVLQQK